MQDHTHELARRLGIDPRVLALLVAAPWRPASGDGGTPPAGDDDPPARGRVFVGVPSPSELRDLDLPADGLRHFGLTPAELRAGGWTDADLRSAGLPVPGAGPDVDWFVAGEPAQLMLGLAPYGPPRLARPRTRWDGHLPVLDPVEEEEVRGLAGCTDPDDEQAAAVRDVRDRLLRRARRRLVHCPFCLRQVPRDDTTYGACHACASRWLGILH